ncbi:hypothetical protein HOY80DRAFT_964172 [Tuber brumale]|nr:hypothetical protein HOY80DRAFT_964172 [Tuber brumale]
MLLRHDDMDGNCAQAQFPGHWCGSNATSETVICQMYDPGRTATKLKTNIFSVPDPSHRIFHVTSAGEGWESNSRCEELGFAPVVFRPGGLCERGRKSRHRLCWCFHRYLLCYPCCSHHLYHH